MSAHAIPHRVNNPRIFRRVYLGSGEGEEPLREAKRKRGKIAMVDPVYRRHWHKPALFTPFIKQGIHVHAGTYRTFFREMIRNRQRASSFFLTMPQYTLSSNGSSLRRSRVFDAQLIDLIRTLPKVLTLNGKLVVTTDYSSVIELFSNNAPSHGLIMSWPTKLSERDIRNGSRDTQDMGLVEKSRIYRFTVKRKLLRKN